MIFIFVFYLKLKFKKWYDFCVTLCYLKKDKQKNIQTGEKQYAPDYLIQANKNGT